MDVIIHLVIWSISLELCILREILCALITQKHRPQSTELGVIFSCVETVRGFQDVENWAVKDLEGRNWETWIILINIHRLNQKENDKLQFWSCLDLSLLWEQGWQTWELGLKKKILKYSKHTEKCTNYECTSQWISQIECTCVPIVRSRKITLPIPINFSCSPFQLLHCPPAPSYTNTTGNHYPLF